MAGLIEKSMQAPSEEAEEQAPVEQEASPQEGQELMPEQAAQERVTIAAARVLYDKATNPAIMKMLAAGPTPDLALANTVASILDGLTQQSGGQVTPEMKLPAAGMLLMLAAELAEAAGIFKADQKTLMAAFEHLTKQGAAAPQPVPQAAQPQPQQPKPKMPINSLLHTINSNRRSTRTVFTRERTHTGI